jgi:hypothetical protein
LETINRFQGAFDRQFVRVVEHFDDAGLARRR